jgi:hypothetical protein
MKTAPSAERERTARTCAVLPGGDSDSAEPLSDCRRGPARPGESAVTVTVPRAGGQSLSTSRLSARAARHCATTTEWRRFYMVTGRRGTIAVRAVGPCDPSHGPRPARDRLPTSVRVRVQLEIGSLWRGCGPSRSLFESLCSTVIVYTGARACSAPVSRHLCHVAGRGPLEGRGVLGGVQRVSQLRHFKAKSDKNVLRPREHRCNGSTPCGCPF